VNVSVELPAPGAAIEAGLNWRSPPWQSRNRQETEELKPPLTVVEIVWCPRLPWVTDKLAGEALTVKSVSPTSMVDDGGCAVAAHLRSSRQSATPDSRSALRRLACRDPGSSGTTTISTTVSGGFNSSVSLSVSGLPTGVSASLAPPLSQPQEPATYAPFTGEQHRDNGYDECHATASAAVLLTGDRRSDGQCRGDPGLCNQRFAAQPVGDPKAARQHDGF